MTRDAIDDLYDWLDDLTTEEMDELMAEIEFEETAGVLDDMKDCVTERAKKTTAPPFFLVPSYNFSMLAH